MSRAKNLTKEEKNEIRRCYFELKMPPKAIAFKFSRSESTVLKLVGPLRNSHVTREERAAIRHDYHVLKLTMLEVAGKYGRSISTICVHVGRGRSPGYRRAAAKTLADGQAGGETPNELAGGGAV